MAFVTLMVLASPVLILLLRAAWITLSCYFLTPLRIRRIMARQGVHGPPPRPLIGNLRDVSALVAQATADDMPALSHDIVGRLMPHYVLWSRTYGESEMARMYQRPPPHCTVDRVPLRRWNVLVTRVFVRACAAGKLFVYWYGSEPRLCLTDAAQIKEFLSSKYAANATGKSWLQRQGTRHFIGRGLLMANGAHWSHQRHVVAPAFMPDKLKVRRARRRRRHHYSHSLYFFSFLFSFRFFFLG
jgi:cytokinin trans-hydroxylase